MVKAHRPVLRRLKAVIADVRSRPNAYWAIRRALWQPRLLVRYLRRTGSSAWIRALFNSQQEYEQLVCEIRESQLLRSLQCKLGEAFSGLAGTTVRGVPYVHGAMKTNHACGLYSAVRKKRPAAVVETGVCNGFSTAILLEALRRNGAGRLYSVDLPEMAGDTEGGLQFWSGKGGAVVPPGRPSGWLIPDSLRERWLLSLGRSSEVLPELLERLGKIDLFIHDSEHSFENQLFEFRLAWQHLRPGGLIAASDINCSEAFTTFQQQVGAGSQTYFVDDGMAIMIRSEREP